MTLDTRGDGGKCVLATKQQTFYQIELHCQYLSLPRHGRRRVVPANNEALLLHCRRVTSDYLVPREATPASKAYN